MCLFCEIIKGNIPSRKVYEDDNYLAILDIAQTTKGHTLVMPKKHYDTYLDMPADEFAALLKKTHEIAGPLLKNVKANGNNLLINTNPVAGQSIMHVHTHIIPRYTEEDTIRLEFTENSYDLDEVLKECTNA
ncbi:MAG: HIT family protein [Erysipelotrichaceae bacterium]|nr:HIT family protein [Erysipelotrichaceae bacterium]